MGTRFGSIPSDRDGVSLADLADLATDRIIGRVSSGTGVPEALTPAQVREVAQVAARSLSYEMFGGIGDGSDEGAIIDAAHDAANAAGIPIVQQTGTWNFGSTRNIPIATDCDWTGATLVVDQAQTPTGEGQVFSVLSEDARNTLTEGERTSLLAEMVTGATDVYLPAIFGENDEVFVRVIDAATLRAARHGSFTSAGTAQRDFFIIERGGRLVGDIVWPWTAISTADWRLVDREPLTLRGGEWQLDGQLPTGAARRIGFHVTRDRVTFQNLWVGHQVGEDDASGVDARFNGFISAADCAYLTLKDLRLAARQVATPSTGTYAAVLDRVLAVTIDGVTSEGDYPQTWGWVLGQQVRDLTVRRSYLNRLDCHFNAYNMTVDDCVVGGWSIRLHGGGRLNVSRTTVKANTFLKLRDDYGATWDGPIDIKASHLEPDTHNPATIIDASGVLDENYGQPVVQGRSVDLDVTVDWSSQPAVTHGTVPVEFADISSTDGTDIVWPTFVRSDVREIGKTVHVARSGTLGARGRGSRVGETFYDGSTLWTWDGLAWVNPAAAISSAEAARRTATYYWHAEDWDGGPWLDRIHGAAATVVNGVRVDSGDTYNDQTAVERTADRSAIWLPGQSNSRVDLPQIAQPSTQLFTLAFGMRYHVQSGDFERLYATAVTATDVAGIEAYLAASDGTMLAAASNATTRTTTNSTRSDFAAGTHRTVALVAAASTFGTWTSEDPTLKTATRPTGSIGTTNVPALGGPVGGGTDVSAELEWVAIWLHSALTAADLARLA